MPNLSAPSQDEVTIDGEICSIWIYQKSTSEWVAYGDCGRRSVSATGSSYNNARQNWRKTAEALNG